MKEVAGMSRVFYEDPHRPSIPTYGPGETHAPPAGTNVRWLDGAGEGVRCLVPAFAGAD